MVRICQWVPFSKLEDIVGNKKSELKVLPKPPLVVQYVDRMATGQNLPLYLQGVGKTRDFPFLWYISLRSENN